MKKIYLDCTECIEKKLNKGWLSDLMNCRKTKMCIKILILIRGTNGKALGIFKEYKSVAKNYVKNTLFSWYFLQYYYYWPQGGIFLSCYKSKNIFLITFTNKAFFI